MDHGTYTGPRPELRGKAALLLPGDREGEVKAQFDDTSTGYGYGWHNFPSRDFRIAIKVRSD